MRRLVGIALDIAESIEKAWGGVDPTVRMWAGMYGKTFGELRAAYAHRLEVIAAGGPRPRSHESPERIRQQMEHFAAIKGAMDEIAQGKATSQNVGVLRGSAEALQQMWAKSEKSASPADASRTSGPDATASSSRPAEVHDRPSPAQAETGTGGVSSSERRLPRPTRTRKARARLTPRQTPRTRFLLIRWNPSLPICCAGFPKPGRHTVPTI